MKQVKKINNWLCLLIIVLAVLSIPAECKGQLNNEYNSFEESAQNLNHLTRSTAFSSAITGVSFFILEGVGMKQKPAKWVSFGVGLITNTATFLIKENQDTHYRKNEVNRALIGGVIGSFSITIAIGSNSTQISKPINHF